MAEIRKSPRHDAVNSLSHQDDQDQSIGTDLPATDEDTSDGTARLQLPQLLSLEPTARAALYTLYTSTLTQGTLPVNAGQRNQQHQKAVAAGVPPIAVAAVQHLSSQELLRVLPPQLEWDVLLKDMACADATGQAAYQLVGLLLQTEAVGREMADAGCQELLRVVLADMQPGTRKERCKLALWVIATQQLPAAQLAGRARQLLGALKYCLPLDNPWGSPLVSLQAARALKRLLRELPAPTRAAAPEWAPGVWRLMLATGGEAAEGQTARATAIKQAREEAVALTQQLAEVLMALQHRDGSQTGSEGSGSRKSTAGRTASSTASGRCTTSATTNGGSGGGATTSGGAAVSGGSDANGVVPRANVIKQEEADGVRSEGPVAGPVEWDVLGNLLSTQLTESMMANITCMLQPVTGLDRNASVPPAALETAMAGVAAWTAAVQLLGRTFLRQPAVGQKMLDTLKSCFTCQATSDLSIAAFAAWRQLADSFYGLGELPRSSDRTAAAAGGQGKASSGTGAGGGGSGSSASGGGDGGGGAAGGSGGAASVHATQLARVKLLLMPVEHALRHDRRLDVREAAFDAWQHVAQLLVQSYGGCRTDERPEVTGADADDLGHLIAGVEGAALVLEGGRVGPGAPSEANMQEQQQEQPLPEDRAPTELVEGAGRCGVAVRLPPQDTPIRHRDDASLPYRRATNNSRVSQPPQPPVAAEAPYSDARTTRPHISWRGLPVDVWVAGIGVVARILLPPRPAAAEAASEGAGGSGHGASGSRHLPPLSPQQQQQQHRGLPSPQQVAAVDRTVQVLLKTTGTLTLQPLTQLLTAAMPTYDTTAAAPVTTSSTRGPLLVSPAVVHSTARRWTELLTHTYGNLLAVTASAAVRMSSSSAAPTGTAPTPAEGPPEVANAVVAWHRWAHLAKVLLPLLPHPGSPAASECTAATLSAPAGPAAPASGPAASASGGSTAPPPAHDPVAAANSGCTLGLLTAASDMASPWQVWVRLCSATAATLAVPTACPRRAAAAAAAGKDRAAAEEDKTAGSRGVAGAASGGGGTTEAATGGGRSGGDEIKEARIVQCTALRDLLRRYGGSVLSALLGMCVQLLQAGGLVQPCRPPAAAGWSAAAAAEPGVSYSHGGVGVKVGSTTRRASATRLPDVTCAWLAASRALDPLGAVAGGGGEGGEGGGVGLATAAGTTALQASYMSSWWTEWRQHLHALLSTPGVSEAVLLASMCRTTLLPSAYVAGLAEDDDVGGCRRRRCRASPSPLRLDEPSSSRPHPRRSPSPSPLLLPSTTRPQAPAVVLPAAAAQYGGVCPYGLVLWEAAARLLGQPSQPAAGALGHGGESAPTPLMPGEGGQAANRRREEVCRAVALLLTLPLEAALLPDLSGTEVPDAVRKRVDGICVDVVEAWELLLATLLQHSRRAQRGVRQVVGGRSRPDVVQVAVQGIGVRLLDLFRAQQVASPCTAASAATWTLDLPLTWHLLGRAVVALANHLPWLAQDAPYTASAAGPGPVLAEGAAGGSSSLARSPLPSAAGLRNAATPPPCVRGDVTPPRSLGGVGGGTFGSACTPPGRGAVVAGGALTPPRAGALTPPRGTRPATPTAGGPPASAAASLAAAMATATPRGRRTASASATQLPAQELGVQLLAELLAAVVRVLRPCAAVQQHQPSAWRMNHEEPSPAEDTTATERLAATAVSSRAALTVTAEANAGLPGRTGTLAAGRDPAAAATVATTGGPVAAESRIPSQPVPPPVAPWSRSLAAVTLVQVLDALPDVLMTLAGAGGADNTGVGSRGRAAAMEPTAGESTATLVDVTVRALQGPLLDVVRDLLPYLRAQDVAAKSGTEGSGVSGSSGSVCVDGGNNDGGPSGRGSGAAAAAGDSGNGGSPGLSEVHVAAAVTAVVGLLCTARRCGGDVTPQLDGLAALLTACLRFRSCTSPRPHRDDKLNVMNQEAAAAPATGPTPAVPNAATMPQHATAPAADPCTTHAASTTTTVAHPTDDRGGGSNPVVGVLPQAVCLALESLLPGRMPHLHPAVAEHYSRLYVRQQQLSYAVAAGGQFAVQVPPSTMGLAGPAAGSGLKALLGSGGGDDRGIAQLAAVGPAAAGRGALNWEADSVSLPPLALPHTLQLAVDALGWDGGFLLPDSQLRPSSALPVRQQLVRATSVPSAVPPQHGQHPQPPRSPPPPQLPQAQQDQRPQPLAQQPPQPPLSTPPTATPVEGQRTNQSAAAMTAASTPPAGDLVASAVGPGVPDPTAGLPLPAATDPVGKTTSNPAARDPGNKTTHTSTPAGSGLRGLNRRGVGGAKRSFLDASQTEYVRIPPPSPGAVVSCDGPEVTGTTTKRRRRFVGVTTYTGLDASQAAPVGLIAMVGSESQGGEEYDDGSARRTVFGNSREGGDCSGDGEVREGKESLERFSDACRALDIGRLDPEGDVRAMDSDGAAAAVLCEVNAAAGELGRCADTAVACGDDGGTAAAVMPAIDVNGSSARPVAVVGVPSSSGADLPPPVPLPGISDAATEASLHHPHDPSTHVPSRQLSDPQHQHQLGAVAARQHLGPAGLMVPTSVMGTGVVAGESSALALVVPSAPATAMPAHEPPQQHPPFLAPYIGFYPPPSPGLDPALNSLPAGFQRPISPGIDPLINIPPPDLQPAIDDVEGFLLPGHLLPPTAFLHLHDDVVPLLAAPLPSTPPASRPGPGGSRTTPNGTHGMANGTGGRGGGAGGDLGVIMEAPGVIYADVDMVPDSLEPQLPSAQPLSGSFRPTSGTADSALELSDGGAARGGGLVAGRTVEAGASTTSAAAAAAMVGKDLTGGGVGGGPAGGGSGPSLHREAASECDLGGGSGGGGLGSQEMARRRQTHRRTGRAAGQGDGANGGPASMEDQASGRSGNDETGRGAYGKRTAAPLTGKRGPPDTGTLGKCLDGASQLQLEGSSAGHPPPLKAPTRIQPPRLVRSAAATASAKQSPAARNGTTPDAAGVQGSGTRTMLFPGAVGGAGATMGTACTTRAAPDTLDGVDALELAATQDPSAVAHQGGADGERGGRKRRRQDASGRSCAQPTAIAAPAKDHIANAAIGAATTAGTGVELQNTIGITDAVAQRNPPGKAHAVPTVSRDVETGVPNSRTEHRPIAPYPGGHTVLLTTTTTATHTGTPVGQHVPPTRWRLSTTPRGGRGGRGREGAPRSPCTAQPPSPPPLLPSPLPPRLGGVAGKTAGNATNCLARGGQQQQEQEQETEQDPQKHGKVPAVEATVRQGERGGMVARRAGGEEGGEGAGPGVHAEVDVEGELATLHGVLRSGRMGRAQLVRVGALLAEMQVSVIRALAGQDQAF